MTSDISEIRRRSAALFGNEKVVEVVLAMARTEAPHSVTAQDVSKATEIAHSLVRDVLVRLATSEVLVAVPKVGGSRAAQYYQPRADFGWTQLVAMAELVESRSVARGR
jgi:hypothetical protein